jgi:ATP-dependent Lon protease
MVETRNQKRKCTQEISAVIKKKKTQNEQESEIISDSEIEFDDQEIDTDSDSLEIELNDQEDQDTKNTQDNTQDIQNKENVQFEIINVIQSLSKIYNEFQNFLQYKNQQELITDKNSEDSDFNCEFSKFNEILESIFTSDFFERSHFNEKLKEMSHKDIEFFTNELTKIQNHYKNGPNIIDIIKLNVPIEQKRHLLEVVHHLENCDVLSQEYNNNLRYLENSIKEATRDPELIKLEQLIQQKALSNKQDNYKTKVLKSKMSFDNKIIAYQKLEIMESYEHGQSDEFIKYKNWMDTLLNIPFGIYNNIPVNINSSTSQEIGSYIRSVRNTLDSQLSFLEKPKDQIINIVTQMIRNPDCNINAIGLYGTKGVGKSAISDSIAKALNRPLRTISLGGESDSSNLTGHNFTYIGSQPGRFIEILKETQTMNPIILIDELDKISATEKGNEIIGTLIHLTDSTTNNKYNIDKYFSGVEFDLSKVLFIFTYNDPTKIDKILSDRLYKIKVDNYNFKEKLEIVNKHLINNILNKLQLSDSISFSQDAIEHLVRESQKDEGLRTIKTKIKIILTRINMLLLTNKDDNIIKLKYNKLYNFYKTLPLVIPKEHIDIFLDESISSELESTLPPFGMYI